MIDELTQLFAFQNVPNSELEWLIENSSEEILANGEFFFEEGGPVEKFYVVLEGELIVTRTFDGQKQVMGTTPAGIIGGELGLLNALPAAPISSQAIMPSRLMVFNAHKFREIFAACPNFAAYIFQVAIERTQGYATYLQQQEKMAALGKLSAGLAHELNNPAAATRRAAKTLRETLPDLQQGTLHLCALGLTPAQIDELAGFQQNAVAQAATMPPLSTLEQSDREDELGDWLEEQGVENGWDLASTFVSAGMTPDELIDLVEPLPPQSLAAVIKWLHKAMNAVELLDEIEETSRRISDLVKAIKEYTYMDRAAFDEVDIHRGLETTLKVLNHKLKNITVKREFDPNMPPILAKGGELNQVWTNLIDNAIDAMTIDGTENGELKLITRHENKFVMIEIKDNGSGIPANVKPRLFDPFFTTKEVGSGTGLGLDIVYRIVKQHHGAVEVWSEPGETRFIVRLPIDGVEAEA